MNNFKLSECSKCGNGRYKTIIRKNYPFGRNSNPRVTKWKVCRNCGDSKLIPKEEKKKQRFR